MRVKWNRNLDGIRPLITVPETDVIIDNENFENNNSFTDLNDNNTVNTVNDSESQIDSTRMKCESPSPSFASITSKRSEKSKVRISSLFGLFRIKDKLEDNGNEDGVSNYSELSNTTINSNIPLISKRKSTYESGDAFISGEEKIGFEADTRRRRRANTLLSKSSMRRSWQQLNVGNKSPINSGYIISKDIRNTNHCSNFLYTPFSTTRHKVSEPDLLIANRSLQNRVKSDTIPEVRPDMNNDKTNLEEGNTEPNRTRLALNTVRDSLKRDNYNSNEVINSSVFNKTVIETVNGRQTHSISTSDLSGKDSVTACGCDESDNKVQSVGTAINWFDFEQNILNNSKTICDPKNEYKNTITQQNLISDKNCNNVCELKSQNRNCVTNDKIDSLALNLNLNLNSDNITAISGNKVQTIVEVNNENEENIPFDKHNDNDNDSKDSKETEEKHNFSEELIHSNDIIKVKVVKNELPEFEMVSFSAQIVSSPSTVSTTNITPKTTNDALVVTFINDEPMVKEVQERENTKSSDIFVKTTPIQGILRLRTKDSNCEDKGSHSFTKTTEHKTSQKKVHFADNCLHNRNSSRGRSRSIKPRHYGSYGVVASVSDRKTTNRRPTQTNIASTGLTSKRVSNNKINTSTANSKRDVRSIHLIDDKQIQKLTELCESKTKQLKTLCIDQNYMRLAFDSLTIVIQHIIEQFSPFENPKIKRALKNANKRCEQLKDNLGAKDVELNDMKIIFEEQINQLMKEREKNFSDLNEAKLIHESNIKKLKEMHFWEVKKLEDKHNRELQLSQQNCNELLNEIDNKNSELLQTKQLKEELEIKVNQIEDNIMNDKDKKFKYLTEKTKQLELEVESLKSVMDMKNEKIHSLERKMIETQEKINELPFAKETIRSLQQQIENLQMTLDRKIHQYNQLTREHEDLKSEYEKEMREKRRLSMKNEELVFHLSESFNESITGFNVCTNSDSNHFRFKSPAISIDETPIKTNRNPINACTSASISSRKSHIKTIRSTSTSTSKSLNNPRRVNTTTPVQCSTAGSDNENNFLSNGLSDEVFDNKTSFSDSNRILDSNKKLVKIKRSAAVADEMPPQCILDSGFEEIQGLNSLHK